MNVVWQDHDRVQRRPDGGALLGLLHRPLPAHRRQGQVTSPQPRPTIALQLALSHIGICDDTLLNRCLIELGFSCASTC